METGICCAYNLSKSSTLSSKVTIADCAGQPFKLMKFLLDHLAHDAGSGFWLTHLSQSPQIIRLFPFDFVYLDKDCRIVQAVELPPEAPLPRFHDQAESALILPFSSLSSAQTQEGDLLLICPEPLLQAHIAARNSIMPDSSSSANDDPPVCLEESPEPPSPIASPPEPVTPPQGLALQTGFTLSRASTWEFAKSGVIAVASAPAKSPEDQANAGADQAPSILPSELPGEEAGLLPEAAAVETESVERNTSSSNREIRKAAELAAEPVITSDSPVESSLETSIDSVQAAKRRKAEAGAGDRVARSKEAAEKGYIKVSPARSDALKTKKKTKEKPGPPKDHLGTRVIRWLNLDDPPPERRKIIRLLLEGLEAYDLNGDRSKTFEVRDVCPPGLYLRSDEPWQVGEMLSLMLEKNGATEHDHEHRVRIQTRVVRCDEEGAGLEFVFPEGTEFQPWQRVHTKRSDETEADFILRELRLARALGFLCRLCPGAAAEIKHALVERLSNKRVASAVEVALKAEDTLTSSGNAGKVFVHPDIAMRILEGGSWIEEDWIRRMWAGLLVSSCSQDGLDTSNLSFIELLARLTPIHLRVLSFVCHKGFEALAAGRPEAKLDLYSSAEELMEAADSHSFSRIQQTIGQLSHVGLLADSARASYVTISDKSKTRTTPTALGLKMYARCNGHRS